MAQFLWRFQKRNSNAIKECFDQVKYKTDGGSKMNKKIKDLWLEFGDVPMNPDSEEI